MAINGLNFLLLDDEEEKKQNETINSQQTKEVIFTEKQQDTPLNNNDDDLGDNLADLTKLLNSWKIKIIGIGGAGTNIVNYLIKTRE
jgi:cell division GTPase FtsZ